jgi:hypothetical protein
MAIFPKQKHTDPEFSGHFLGSIWNAPEPHCRKIEPLLCAGRVMANSPRLMCFPVATLAKQVGRNSFFYRQQVAICLALISFSYSQSGEQVTPQNLFLSPINILKFRQFGELSPLLDALVPARLDRPCSSHFSNVTSSGRVGPLRLFPACSASLSISIARGTTGDTPGDNLQGCCI